MESVAVTMPWLQGRSIGGAMMTLGHLVFALHVLLMIVKSGAFALTESRSAAVRRTAELEV
jgi:cytochrome c oxidase cbb3-type subunit 1